MMPTGEVLAVKVLASNSKQGEKEFQTEVKARLTTIVLEKRTCCFLADIGIRDLCGMSKHAGFSILQERAYSNPSIFQKLSHLEQNL